jgi:hypothetical protein
MVRRTERNHECNRLRKVLQPFTLMSEKLKLEFPAQGWKQFLTSRKEILDAFDRAKQKAKAHEVETFHGNVAEAELRKWLSGFLPKRYGVTSGYIVSPGLKSSEKTPHFDVITMTSLRRPSCGSRTLLTFHHRDVLSPFRSTTCAVFSRLNRPSLRRTFRTLWLISKTSP